MTPTVNCLFCRRNSSARASPSSSSSTTSKPRSRILSTMVSSLSVDASKVTAAYSVARLTSTASMPSIFLRCRVMVLVQLSQCIPVMGRLIWCFIFYSCQFGFSTKILSVISYQLRGFVYSKTGNYLYTNTMARFQISPAAVGVLVFWQTVNLFSDFTIITNLFSQTTDNR